jgi:hypothetical protein
VVGDARAVEPVTPEAVRRSDPRFCLVRVFRGGELLGPGECAVRAFSDSEHVPAADAVSLDAEGEIGAKTDRLPGAGRVGRMPVLADQGPLCRGAAVVERRLADELDLDLPVDAFDGAH